MRELSLPANMCFAASTRGGKTFLLKRLLRSQFLQQTDYLVVFSPTCKMSGDWVEFPENADPKRGKVIQYFEDENEFIKIFKEIIESQKKLLDKHRKSEIPHVFIVLDDCLGTKILRLGGPVDSFSVKSRHYNVSMAVLAQKITAIPRTLRLNQRYFFMFNSANFSELERFITEYCPAKYKKTVLDALEEIYNVDYNFILVDNFERALKNRLWLNGEDNLIEKFKSDSK